MSLCIGARAVRYLIKDRRQNTLAVNAVKSPFNLLQPLKVIIDAIDKLLDTPAKLFSNALGLEACPLKVRPRRTNSATLSVPR